MKITFNAVFLISLSIFSSAILDSWVTYHSFFEVCCSLIEDNWKRLVSYIMAILFIIASIKSIMSLTIGKLRPSESRKAFDNIIAMVVHIFYYVFIGVDVEDNALLQFIGPICLRYLIYTIRQKVLGLPLSTSYQSDRFHQNMLFIQTILALCCIFGIQYSSFLLYKTIFVQHINLQFPGVLLLEYFQGLLDEILDVFRHIVFLSDRSNFGNSQYAYRFTSQAEEIFDILHLAAELVFMLYQILINKFPIGGLASLLLSCKKISENYTKYKRWSHLETIIKTALENATQEEIDRDDTCIVCRLPMIVGDSKKLPCPYGHCIHTDCLERLIAQKSQCPICHYDLTQFLAEAEARIKEEQNQRSNQQNISNQDRPIMEEEQPIIEENQRFNFNDLIEQIDDVE